MEMNRLRVSIVVFMMVLCICGLAACGSMPGVTPSPSPLTSEIKAASPSNPKPSESTMTSTPDNIPSALMRTDTDGLVQVRIANGEAFLAFDWTRWDELYCAYDLVKEYVYDPERTFRFDEEEIQGKFFPIADLSGKVVDACIGQVVALDTMKYPSFVTPTVILLLEDGSLEWMLADPFAPTNAEILLDEYYSMGHLPWVKNITALSYESDNEGLGTMTIFATDAAGARYDVRDPCFLTHTFSGVWYTTLIPGETDPPVNGYLRLHPDGSADYKIGYENSELLETWLGTYTVILGEGQELPPGTIAFDFSLDQRYFDDIGHEGLPAQIQGSYRFTIDMNSNFTLYLNDGDLLCPTFTIDNPDLYPFRMIFDN